MRQKLFITATTLGLVGGALITAQPSQAFWPIDAFVGGETAEHSDNQFPPMIQRLINHFNLNETEVQAVIDEEQADHHAHMQQNFEERLSQLVTNGKITEEQKQAIIQKHEEIAAQMQDLQGLGREEHREQTHQNHEQHKAWLEEQGIDTDHIRLFSPEFGMGYGPRPRPGISIGNQMGSNN